MFMVWMLLGTAYFVGVATWLVTWDSKRLSEKYKYDSMVRNHEYEFAKWMLQGTAIWPLLAAWGLFRWVARGVGSRVGEKGRLRRELKRIERERELLKLRGEVEVARQRYNQELNAYLEEG